MNEAYRVMNLVGTPTDYSDSNNWAYLPENTDKKVDTFFVYPSVYFSAAPDAPVIVPVDDAKLRGAVKNNFVQGAQLFADLTNLFEPYYRQSNLIAVLGMTPQEYMELQLREPRTDLYAALDYYFANYNQGHPFILAGHSQGTFMLKIALRDYFRAHPDYLERMVAAYLPGFSVTSEDLAANPALKFAECADDTGVIVSWNTEGPENKNEHNCVVMNHALSINPLNWKRDETYAPASENAGSRIPIKDENGVVVQFQVDRPGLLDAKLDIARGVVVCTTKSDQYVTMSKPELRNPFGPASLHTLDYPGYWDNIRENVKARINAYFNR